MLTEVQFLCIAYDFLSVSVCFCYAPGAIRTRGTGIRNPVLYPPELRGLEGEVSCLLYRHELRTYPIRELFVK